MKLRYIQCVAVLLCLSAATVPHQAEAKPDTTHEAYSKLVKFMKKTKGNEIAILVIDGPDDEITGKQIADKLIMLFEKRGVTPTAFIGIPTKEKVKYSRVGYYIGELSYGPYDIVTAKEKIPTIMGAYQLQAGIDFKNFGTN